MVVSLSLSLRVLVNLESLNMAESIGNVVKHRRAPVVVKNPKGGYNLVYVPVISGMSLAHGYQVLLAHAAKELGAPVTRMSLEGYFLKFATNNIIKNHYKEVEGRVSKNRSPCENEREIVKACTVADVGGFLYTEGVVKRTSRFSFTYMMPTLDTLTEGIAGISSQLHTRYAPEAKKQEQAEQALFNIDNASALYTLTFLLEASRISQLDVCKAMNQKPDDLGADERKKRFEAALSALVSLVSNVGFGAKKTRSFPHWQVQSAVIVASDSIAPIIPSPGHSSKYIEETVEKIEKLQKLVKNTQAVVHYYDREDATENVKGAERHTTVEQAISEAAEWVRQRL